MRRQEARRNEYLGHQKIRARRQALNHRHGGDRTTYHSVGSDRYCPSEARADYRRIHHFQHQEQHQEMNKKSFVYQLDSNLLRSCPPLSGEAAYAPSGAYQLGISLTLATRSFANRYSRRKSKIGLGDGSGVDVTPLSSSASSNI